MTTPYPVCPHCNQPLRAFELPDNTGWQGEFQLACFNDDCPYFVRGWQHMLDNYAVKASYRFRFDPSTGESSPLAVWSPDALKDRIIDAAVDDTARTDGSKRAENGESS
ncbi:MAG: hypothetical protein MUE90_05470 [Thermoanaerobaculales bacterium]|jgi:hypothetical protein|nr:hypothetical protein [Thermoanaerobaculales bacterium]